MKILYFDCFSGISGDMTLGALIDAGVDAEFLRAQLSSLGLKAQLVAKKVKKSGFAATQVQILTEPEHAHRHLRHIREIIEASAITDTAKSIALKIFEKLAEAEAAAHGSTVEKVHFHEVGALDSIMDIVGTAVALDYIGPERIISSPVPPGSGTVKGAHGVMPVPAPGTAALLRGIPIQDLGIEAELTTPTGAAILASMADDFGELPAMTIGEIGYGAGQRDLEERANILRVFVGQDGEGQDAAGQDQVCVLESNLDDVPSEWIGHCIELLLEAGALDVFTQGIGMKKNRPGTMLSIICRPEDRCRLEHIIFRETGTLGVRRSLCKRSILRRTAEQVETQWGTIQGKLATLPGGQTVFSPEFESCREVSIRIGRGIRDVYTEAILAWRHQHDSQS